MKLRKIVTRIMASALMACSLSAVSANAAAAVNADVTKSAQIVGNLDRIISLRKTMPLKGDINGDKKVTVEDTTVLEVYLKGLITINKNSTAYKVLDVNWDGKLDSSDLALMPKKINLKSDNSKIVLPSISYKYLHTGDFNNDGVVNSKDLTILKNQTGSIVIKPVIKIDNNFAYSADNVSELLPIDDLYIGRRISVYDLNQDGYVDLRDYMLLSSYISSLSILPLY